MVAGLRAGNLTKTGRPRTGRTCLFQPYWGEAVCARRGLPATFDQHGKEVAASRGLYKQARCDSSALFFPEKAPKKPLAGKAKNGETA
jgi:hypothetical protein